MTTALSVARLLLTDAQQGTRPFIFPSSHTLPSELPALSCCRRLPGTIYQKHTWIRLFTHPPASQSPHVSAAQISH